MAQRGYPYDRPPGPRPPPPSKALEENMNAVRKFLQDLLSTKPGKAFWQAAMVRNRVGISLGLLGTVLIVDSLTRVPRSRSQEPAADESSSSNQ